jgi:hypothetical protein
MKHDLFEFNPQMTRTEIFWRVALLGLAIAVLILDVFFWRA